MANITVIISIFDQNLGTQNNRILHAIISKQGNQLSISIIRSHKNAAYLLSSKREVPPGKQRQIYI